MFRFKINLFIILTWIEKITKKKTCHECVTVFGRPLYLGIYSTTLEGVA